nr:hypothetical protein [Tanacetum cinerariifolium]
MSHGLPRWQSMCTLCVSLTNDLVKFSKLIVFAHDPFAHTLSNELSLKCQLGFGVDSMCGMRECVGKYKVRMSTPKVVNEVGKDDVQESFPPLSTSVTTTAGNALGKSSYANITGKPSGKKVNVRTLFTPGGNGIYVVVPVDSICAISKRFANTAYGFFLRKKVAYRVIANYVSNTWDYPLILKKWHPDDNLLKEDASTVPFWVKLHGVPVMAFSGDGLSAIATKLELKDNIVVAMPKITGEGHYICNVCVEYEWKSPRCAPCKVFGHIHEECPKNTGAGEKMTVKKPSQTSRGVLVGPKMSFKPQKEYRPVPKKPSTSFSGNKMKGVKLTIEVNNSNQFEVLNSVDNDVAFGTNEGTTNLSFRGEYDSEDEVASVDNDMARSMTSERVGFDTQSLLEQWRDSYGNGDYDDDPYDDMYEGQDLS